MKQIADEKNKTNPSQLGDPVSLRAETSDTKPTPDDLGAKGSQPISSKGNADQSADGKGEKTLKQRAEEKLDKNPSQLGDPVSMKAETSDTEVTRDDRGALPDGVDGKNKGKPKL